MLKRSEMREVPDSRENKLPLSPRQLLRRLVSVAMGVAVAVSIVAVMFELELIDEELSSSAIKLAEIAHQTLPANIGALSKDDREDWLRNFLDKQAQPGSNHFIAIELYDPSREELGDAAIVDLTRLKPELDKGKHLFSWKRQAEYRRIWLDGQLYLQVWVTLRGASADTFSGYLEGVFLVSPNNLSALMLRVGLIIGIVLVTAGLCILIAYPVIQRQNQRLLAHSAEITESNIELLKVLGNAIAKRDSDTHSHNYRVTLYSILLAEAVHMPVPAIRSLIKGAFLHDVGKIAIPDRILLKQGPLDEQEFKVMQTHVRHGRDIVQGNPWLLEAVDVVYGHHERFNGSGYPQGLRGKAIPLAARVFCIADVFDALTSERPYKKAFSLDKSEAIMREEAGRHFEPRLLEVFLANCRTWYDQIYQQDDAALEQLLTQKMRQYFATDSISRMS
ncbi:MAG: HD domain-containing protein [Gammaproteobacteria bacterium]|nr:MAG: HD domain-containing protein [Gammaproteobacteria bacterium]